jgi:hypothetical protein
MKEIRNVYKIIVGKPEERRAHTRRRYNNIKMILEEENVEVLSVLSI